MRSPPRAAAACLAALALVAAGCGSSTKQSNAYVGAINKVQSDFATNVQKAGAAPSSGGNPGAAARKTFADLETAIDKVVSDLQAVKPPPKVATLHGQLIAEMGDFKQSVHSAAGAISAKDPQKIAAAQAKFAADASAIGGRISKTIDQINQKLHS
jgi:hypothetical protein